ncbi:HipA domain-containing protein [Catalinimonas sp. 4WD22]|uniref:type II toxin-antitoxin system HipA family toxin n=1 Tax=Catalinimonas locisalis TaxID=3133978 RepID=UPI0031018A73
MSNLSDLKITHCPGTLATGYTTYSKTCLNRLFQGRKVHHILPYDSPASSEDNQLLFAENHKRISISGVQEKFSVLLEKNKLRLVNEGEQGQYILKPIPYPVKNAAQMPANEHLTMQIARQFFGIETAENALIFFRNGEPAYITKRFDIVETTTINQSDVSHLTKWAKEDFASLAGRTPQTHGEHYKYLGSYLELFELMRKYLPAYKLEAPKLLKLLIFNYLFSNGDAHFKNFSLLETFFGDYRLSPAYDLLNTSIHINDSDFALDEGLLPKSMNRGKVREQFVILASEAGIAEKQVDNVLKSMLSNTEKVEGLISTSFLDERFKRNYLQAYQTRLKKMKR